MILIDNSQIILSSLLTKVGENTPVGSINDLTRHITFSMYLSLKKKFSGKYGQMVLCQDSFNYWRKDIFPFYKQNRKKNREKDPQFWSVIFDSVTELKKEVQEHLGYTNISVDRCEADDIIYTLAKRYSIIEPILIVSDDKDFTQLLSIPGVSLYSPRKSAFVTHDNPEFFLEEHILRGDSSDGIPNVLSDDDTILTEGKRQKPLTSKKIQEWYNNNQSEIFKSKNYQRNKSLIDLSYIPEEYQKNIIDKFVQEDLKNKQHKLFSYFTSRKMTMLLNEISEF